MLAVIVLVPIAANAFRCCPQHPEVTSQDKVDCARHNCETYDSHSSLPQSRDWYCRYAGVSSAGGSAAPGGSDIVDKASTLATSSFMKGDVAGGVGAMGLGILGGALQKGNIFGRKERYQPAADDSAAREAAVSAQRARDELEAARARKREQAAREFQTKHAELKDEWMADDAAPKSDAAGAAGDDEWDFRDAPIRKPKPVPPEHGLARNVISEENKVRQRLLAFMKQKSGTVDFTRADFERFELEAKTTFLPESGFRDPLVSTVPGLIRHTAALRAWLALTRFEPNTAMQRYDLALQSCQNIGTAAASVQGLRQCLHQSARNFNDEALVP